jgi:Lrp/AsnC family transcriptional regulator, leucine-responsive regulatory protein
MVPAKRKPTGKRSDLRLALLKLLQQNCAQPNTKLAEQLDIPVSTLTRLRGDIERNKDVRFYKAVLNAKKFGLTTLAFVRLSLKDETKFRQTLNELEAHQEIQEIHTVGQGFDFLVKIRVSSNEELWEFLQDQLSPRHNIQRTETMVVMGTPKETTDVQLPTDQ